MAALSVHSSGGGKCTLNPPACPDDIMRCRRREFLATPPTIRRSLQPSLMIACRHFSTSTSTTAAWYDDAISFTDKGSSRLPSTVLSKYPSRLRYVKSAVFRPLNEKLRSPLSSIGRGRLRCSGLPSLAAFSMAGPPGYPRPSILAALSSASPAASSSVVPMIAARPLSSRANRVVCPPDDTRTTEGHGVPPARSREWM